MKINQTRKWTLLIFFALLLISCKKDYSQIDGSSKDTFEASVESISDKLSILQQDKMKEAVKLVYKYSTDTKKTEDERWQEVYKKLDGKTADQVFVIAEEIAKNNNIKWSSTSMNELDSSVFDDEVKPMENGVDTSQIDNAAVIDIKYSPINNDPELNDGIMIYPNLIDDLGKVINFQNLPLNVTLTFLNKGKVVNVINRQINSSEAGNPSAKKGIKVLYRQFTPESIPDGLVNLEVKASAGNKFLYGKYSQIKIDLSKTKSTVSIQDEIDNQTAADNVSSFLEKVGSKNYGTAYALTRNSKWPSEEAFSSTTNGFGAIDNLKVISVGFSSRTEGKITVAAAYQIKDKSGNTKVLKQNFILNKINDDWLITDTQTKEIKNE